MNEGKKASRLAAVMSLAMLGCGGGPPVGDAGTLPVNGDPCTTAEMAHTVCNAGTQMVCESTIDPNVYLWFHNGPCVGTEGNNR